MTKRPPKKSNHMARADQAFSKYIRARDGECVADGEHAGNLQCAHIISRSYRSIRVNPDNAVCLCARHHLYFTHRPLEWHDWVEARFPGRWDELKREALKYSKVDWRFQAAYWKEQIK